MCSSNWHRTPHSSASAHSPHNPKDCNRMGLLHQEGPRRDLLCWHVLQCQNQDTTVHDSCHCYCSQERLQFCPNALMVPALGISSPRTSQLPRVLLITTVLLISTVVAVVHPIAVQCLGQADREVATGKLPQGTHVHIPGGSQKRVCRGKRRCSVFGGSTSCHAPTGPCAAFQPSAKALLPLGFPDAHSRHSPTGRHPSMGRHSPNALSQPSVPPQCTAASGFLSA